METDILPRLIVFSGAGLSADSGIQTFRGNTGLWEQHDIDVVANGYTWKSNWDIIRQFYNDRRMQLSSVEPNAMHRQIASWQKKYETVILTQNIDDLLERAGCNSVVHLHGKLTSMRCEACGHAWDIGYTAMGEDDRCASPRCNSLKGLRPDVVFFNEMAPEYAKMYSVFKRLTERDIVVVIGTSGHVINIDSFLFDSKSMRILNNLEPSQFIDESLYDHVLYGKASEMAPHINALVTKYMARS